MLQGREPTSSPMARISAARLIGSAGGAGGRRWRGNRVLWRIEDHESQLRDERSPVRGVDPSQPCGRRDALNERGEHLPGRGHALGDQGVAQLVVAAGVGVERARHACGGYLEQQPDSWRQVTVKTRDAILQALTGHALSLPGTQNGLSAPTVRV